MEGDSGNDLFAEGECHFCGRELTGGEAARGKACARCAVEVAFRMMEPLMPPRGVDPKADALLDEMMLYERTGRDSLEVLRKHGLYPWKIGKKPGENPRGEEE